MLALENSSKTCVEVNASNSLPTLGLRNDFFHDSAGARVSNLRLGGRGKVLVVRSEGGIPYFWKYMLCGAFR